jgi:hypothetical protein
VRNPIKLGGPGVIVQMDKIKLSYNVKSHRGRHVHPCWCFCIVNTSYKPALGYATLIVDRSSTTLLSIIETIIIPGSIIYSDKWKAYAILRSSDVYKYGSVCHKYRFVDPQTGFHTQHVESYNNRLKMEIKSMKGLTLDQRSKFLLQFMFRERHKDNLFVAFIKLLSYYTFFTAGVRRAPNPFYLSFNLASSKQLKLKTFLLL